MGLRTVEEYRAGLLDSRRVFYRGRQVKDVAADPDLAPAGAGLGASFRGPVCNRTDAADARATDLALLLA